MERRKDGDQATGKEVREREIEALAEAVDPSVLDAIEVAKESEAAYGAAVRQVRASQQNISFTAAELQ